MNLLHLELRKRSPTDSNLVSRSLTRKKRFSPEKQLELEQKVAYHLGKMKRSLTSGDICEEDIANADETRFVIDFDNGRTLGLAGQDDVKHAEALSAGEDLL